MGHKSVLVQPRKNRLYYVRSRIYLTTKASSSNQSNQTVQPPIRQPVREVTTPTLTGITGAPTGRHRGRAYRCTLPMSSLSYRQLLCISNLEWEQTARADAS